MTWVEIINNASGTIGLCVAFFSGLVIALYQVRVHHKVIFRERGELNFVSVEKYELDQHKTCPVHEASIALIHEVKNIQQGNIQRMNSFEEATKDAVKSRDKIQETMAAINTQLATLIANSVHMSTDIKDLKEQAKA